MALLTDVRTVAANSTVANVLSGKTQEFLTRPSLIRGGVVGAAVGLFATLLIGDTVVVEDQEVSDANRTPIDPDDFDLEGAGFAGDRLVLKLRNSTGAGILAKAKIKVNPAG